MALTKNAVRTYSRSEWMEYPVVAAGVVYQGSAVGENGSGYARALASGDVFLGFAEEKADNSAGSAGDVLARVKTKGQVRGAEISGLAITANDRPAVYMSDDDTFTLTATGNSKIGYVARFVSPGVGDIEFNAALSKA